MVCANMPEGAHVLLLGSTPELRTLVAAHGHRLTGCDVDDAFWHAMSRLCTASGPEEFIHCNWLELPAEGTYDLVLGDCALNMLNWEDMGRMVPRLARMLRAGGRAVFRIQASNPTLSLGTLAEAIEGYPRARTERAFLVALHFLVESLRSTLHPELTNREFYETVVSRFMEPDELRQLLPLTRDRRNFYPQLSALEALFQQDFEVIEHAPCSGPEAWGTTHLFVLEPRGDHSA